MWTYLSVVLSLHAAGSILQGAAMLDFWAARELRRCRHLLARRSHCSRGATRTRCSISLTQCWMLTVWRHLVIAVLILLLAEAVHQPRRAQQWRLSNAVSIAACKTGVLGTLITSLQFNCTQRNVNLKTNKCISIVESFMNKSAGLNG